MSDAHVVVVESDITVAEYETPSQTITQAYEALIKSGEFKADEDQARTVKRLQQMSDALRDSPSSAAPTSEANSLSDKLFSLFSSKPVKKAAWPDVDGLYVWGGVGTGKTFLMNLFFKHLPVEEKLRLNFHRFMHIAHESMKEYSGEQNPLIKVADKFAVYRVICLDEMHVTHISDAMILVALMRELFERGITFIITSNREPEVLYKHGLQRSRFIPVIDMIKQHMEVFPLDSGKDYRTQTMMQQDLYLDSNDPASVEVLQQHFDKLAGRQQNEERHEIVIKNRSIPVVKSADGVVWFTFDAVCDTARSTEDYGDIAKTFRTVILQDVPVIDNTTVDAGRRFINLVYVLYEHNTNLIVSAAAAPEDLYIGGVRLRHPFVRTVSRLIEMRSEEYIAKHNVEVNLTDLKEG